MQVLLIAKTLLSDELWQVIEPLLPPPKPRRFRYPGRKPLDNRKALVGILFVLKTGIPWEYLPQEMGCGSGMTCWRRLRDWQEAGVWPRLVEILQAKLQGANRIDWSRAIVDCASIRALFGGEKTGPNPTDRAKNGSKHHIMTDALCTPFAVTVTGANVNDVTQLLSLLDSIVPIRGKRGWPRKRPDAVQGDRGYDSEPLRRALQRRGITPILAKRNTEHGRGLGVYRWVVERTLAWFHQFRRLRIRYERRVDIHQSFLTLEVALICWNFVCNL